MSERKPIARSGRARDRAVAARYGIGASRNAGSMSATIRSRTRTTRVSGSRSMPIATRRPHIRSPDLAWYAEQIPTVQGVVRASVLSN